MPQEGQGGTGPGCGEGEGSGWGLGGGREMESVFSDLSGHTIEIDGRYPGEVGQKLHPVLGVNKASWSLLLMFKAPSCAPSKPIHKMLALREQKSID